MCSSRRALFTKPSPQSGQENLLAGLELLAAGTSRCGSGEELDLAAITVNTEAPVTLKRR